jgi:hypothetical protein
MRNGIDQDPSAMGNMGYESGAAVAAGGNLMFAGANKKLALGLIGANIVGAALPATVGASGEADATHRTTVHVAGDKVAAESFSKSKVKVIADHRTVTKAQVRKDKRAGNCEYFTAKEIVKEGVRSEGRVYRTGFDVENRASTLCDSDGDGEWDYRAECGNAVKDTKPRPKRAKQVIRVKNFKNAKAVVKDVAVAEETAECKTENTSATSYARAKAVAKGRIKMKHVMKTKGKALNKLINKVRGRAELKASAKAIAKADAECRESVETTVPPTKTPPKEQPKDGTPGAGEGTPGQPGGGGAGGDPGNTEEGVICRDADDKQNGDGNERTKDELMYGREVDQNGYCVGIAEPLQTALGEASVVQLAGDYRSQINVSKVA